MRRRHHSEPSPTQAPGLTPKARFPSDRAFALGGGAAVGLGRAIPSEQPPKIHFRSVSFEVFKQVLIICLTDNNTAKKLFSWEIQSVTRLTITLPSSGLLCASFRYEISEFVPAVEKIDRAESCSTWSWWRICIGGCAGDWFGGWLGG